MDHLEKIEKRLRDRLAELQARVDDIEDERQELGDDDSQEMASETAGDDILESVGHLASDEQKQILRALDRMKQGDYGTCETCGVRIKQARLDAVPHATRCVKCSQKQS